MKRKSCLLNAFCQARESRLLYLHTDFSALHSHKLLIWSLSLQWQTESIHRVENCGHLLLHSREHSVLNFWLSLESLGSILFDCCY